jgi:hypothetical protein
MWMEWFGLNDGRTLKPLKSLGKPRKTKTPPATGAGGVLEKIDDLIQIVNYLPASLVRELSAKPNLSFPTAPDARLYRISGAHTDMPMPSDHWVGCG